MVVDNKIKIAQQVLNPIGGGGVSVEYRTLMKNASEICNQFEFIPMILKDYRRGINWHDIRYYYQFLKKEKPDIVHIRGAAIDSLNAVIAAKLAGKCKILVSVHGMYSDLVYISKFKRFISKHFVERMIFKWCDGISCVCENASKREYFIRYKRKMLPFVYNRIPTKDLSKRNIVSKQIREKYTIPIDAIVGCYVGRMTREKGLEYVYKSLLLLDSVWPENTYFIFVGNGEYKKEFEKKCAELNNKAKIIFTGEKEDVFQFLLASDFFIQASLHENHSIALLEACAARIPSIATNVGGNNEIIEDGITGIIIPKKDEHALFEAIKEMINTDTRKYFSDKINLEKYEKFSDDIINKRLYDVYTMILEKEVNKNEK